MVSKIRSLTSLCLVRIELTLFACEAAPQPDRPEHSIRQSFSVFALASCCWPLVWAAAGIASAHTASTALAVSRIFPVPCWLLAAQGNRAPFIGHLVPGGKPRPSVVPPRRIAAARVLSAVGQTRRRSKCLTVFAAKSWRLLSLVRRPRATRALAQRRCGHGRAETAPIRCGPQDRPAACRAPPDPAKISIRGINRSLLGETAPRWPRGCRRCGPGMSVVARRARGSS